MSQTPDTPSTSDRALTWGVLIALVLAWAAFMVFGRPGQGVGTGPAGLAAPAVPKRTEYRWNLTTLDGTEVDFARFRGKPVFLNIWATWCPPCVKELPSIERLAADPRLSHVQFLLVSDEDPETVRRFVERRGLKAPVFLAGGHVPSEFATDGIPATFILDGEGRVAVEVIGSNEWDAPHVVEFLAGLGAEG